MFKKIIMGLKGNERIRTLLSAFVAIVMAIIILYTFTVCILFTGILRDAHIKYNNLTVGNTSNLIEKKIEDLSNIGYQAFFDTDIRRYFASENESDDMFPGIIYDRLNHYMSQNAFSKRIYVYDESRDMMVCNSGTYIDDEEVNELKELIMSLNSKRKIVPRGEGTNITYSYVIFPYNNSNSAVVIDFYKNLFMQYFEDVSRQFVLDETGEMFIDYSQDEDGSFELIRDELMKKSEPEGSFTIHCADGDRLVVYKKSASRIYVSYVPTKEFTKKIYNTLALILVIIIVIIAILFFVLAYFKYIFYNEVYGILSEVGELKNTIFSIRKNYFEPVLANLLKSSDAVKENYLEMVSTADSLQIDINKPLTIILLKIDDYQIFRNTLSFKTRDALKFGIKNIFHEVLKCELTSINSDDIAIICNTEKDGKDELYERIKYIQNVVDENLGVSFSVCVRCDINSYKNLSDELEKAYSLIEWRFFSGSKTIVKDDFVPMLNDFDSTESENRFLSFVTLRKRDDAILSLNMIFDKSKHLEPAKYKKYMIDLLERFCKKAETIMSGKEKIDSDLKDVVRIIEDAEFFTQVDNIVVDYVDEYMSEIEKGENNSHRKFAEDAVALIEREYNNPNMCREYIANYYHLSVKYANQIFMQYVQTSIPQYILDIRLDKSRELLKNSDMMVNKIAENVGFVNAGHFTQRFKKKYGITPLEYRKQFRETTETDE